MIRTRTTVSPAVVCFILVAFAAHAQVAPIKPGLWQVRSERETNGRKAPDLSERLKNLPPERRAQAEAMMKERGIDASGNIAKICQTREMLDSKHFANSVPDCKITYSTRTNSSWKSHTSCAQNHIESDTEMIFSNPENYTVKTASTIQSDGQTKTSHMTMTGKWLSADCGDVKPLSTKP
ncbi:MAG: DUF3617 domain-containing protein [Acidobacteriota bacterium]|nr:DUF3617 domain-containing protein [Acidobacteriota bacterium]